MNIFVCTKCGNILNGFIPETCVCGFNTPVINGVYQFTNDNPISIEDGGLKWLGYELVGENYEPGYVYNKANDNVGDCKNFAEYMRNGKIILDLGAGLGGSSISFALSGLQAIAADISQVMLEAAIERSKKHNPPSDKIVFARMNGYKLELADNSVDAVLAIDVLHQVDRPELVVDEIIRVLKPNGYFLQYGGGSSKNDDYTEEQAEASVRYEEARKDIQSFYDTLITEAGYSEPPFSSWEKVDTLLKDKFFEHDTIGNTGVYAGFNKPMVWKLKVGLHKIMTRASGFKQLIPDNIHEEAWAKTDVYAKSKYGENYGEMPRYFASGSGYYSGMKLYKVLDYYS